jgi:GNAT superfamily N-acetyltransferase
LEVDDFADYGPETEGFGCYATEAYELDPAAHLIFDRLPGRPGWGCYAAIDRREVGIGTATIWIQGETAQLGFAATREGARGQGAHMALLRRRIIEAGAAGCRTIYAETEELLSDRGGPSAACVNLVRAGFKQVCTRPVWRSPDLDDEWTNI